MCVCHSIPLKDEENYDESERNQEEDYGPASGDQFVVSSGILIFIL